MDREGKMRTVEGLLRLQVAVRAAASCSAGCSESCNESCAGSLGAGPPVGHTPSEENAPTLHEAPLQACSISG
eukprot:12337838-Alexandrium_andersonii.AAC.1